MSSRKVSWLFCIVLFVPGILQASEDFIWRVGWDAGKIAIDETAAKREGIGSNAKSWIRLSGGARIAKYFVTEIGFGIIDTPDQDPFYRTVSGGPISIPHSAESEIVADESFYTVGAFLPVNEKVQFEAALGRSNFSATRKITNCENCTGRTELDVIGGRFMQARLRFGGTKDAAFYIAYRKYSDGDLTRSMLIGITLEKM